ncbi:LlaJI family restriction endonuclease [Hymenobacter ruber]
MLHYIEGRYYPAAKLMEALPAAALTFLYENRLLVKVDEDGAALRQFNFVGFLSFGELLVCVLPKFYRPLRDKDNVDELARLLLQTMEKHGPVTERGDPLDEPDFTADRSPLFDELTVGRELITDYLANGLLIHELKYNELNGPGRIDWEVTVQREYALVTAGGAFYPVTHTAARRSIDSLKLTEIHKAVLNLCVERYGWASDYEITADFDSAVELGTYDDELLQTLRQELNQTYVDSRLRTIRNLISFIEQVNGEESRPNVFGTRFFHRVWEKVCAALFPASGAWKRDLLKPLWHDHSAQTYTDEATRLIPDSVYQCQSQSAIIIIDAKYYNVKVQSTPSLRYDGAPGIGDVLKQFVYEDAVTKAMAGEPPFEIRNCFLFPAADEVSGFPLRHLGFITYDLQAFSGKRIMMATVSANKAFANYVNGGSLRDAEIAAFFLSPV